MKNDIEEIINNVVLDLEFSRADAVQILSEYLESMPESLSDLEQAVKLEDFDKIHNLAHNLKGASSNLRLDEVAKLYAKLCIVSQNKDIMTCKVLFDEINKQIDVLSSLLLKFIHVAS